ncbi:type II secretory pathway component PulJ [Serratia sp. BIGb0234]|uniref:colicin-like pore-forming protein n=1 Tax=Serratia sp. BIGb0234 TaxID=2940614 RepID=UPI0021674BCC|nr:colicin-like pore-forming protein [Serratia sp. BIGb0234]MCS4320746.1 type II secretory pathway component PulJ [Serratia sp. BIGb0234]
MLFNANTKFTYHSPDDGDSMTVTGDPPSRPGPTGPTGNGGDSGGGNTGTINMVIMKPGDVNTSRFGKVIINAEGQATMNGVVMNYENSSLVNDGAGSASRVLNSIINAAKPPAGQNFGNNASISDGRYAGKNPAADYTLPLAIFTAVRRGQIPPGFWLDNNKVMTEITQKYEINGGGKGSDRTGYRKSNVAVPGLTNAYQQWQKEQQDAAKRKADEEARRKADEEARRKAAEEAKRKQVEWGAQNNEQLQQRKLNEVQQQINTASTEKSVAESRATELEKQLPALEAEWDRLIALSKKGGKTSQAILRGDAEDAGNKVNAHKAAIVSARNEANLAQQRIEQAQREKLEAEKRLNALRAERQAREAEEARKKEEEAMKDAIKTTADFYKELTEKFGEQSAKVAKELADAARGKTLKNAEEALKAFEKYKDVLNKKFSVADREAVAKALESVRREHIAQNLAKFSKAFNYTGKVIDAYDVFVVELPKAIRTQNFRPLFVKIETIGAGMAATALTAFAYSVILGTPLGIFGFAIIMTLVSVMVNEKLVEKVNKAAGI